MKKVNLFVFTLMILLSSTMNAQYVYWEPEIPIPGGEITIYYNTIEGALPDNTMPVYIHLGYNGWQDTEDYAMTFQPEIGNGWWAYEYSIPVNAGTIDFVFTDLNNNWDNNGGIGIDWHISLNYYWIPFNPTPNDEISIVLNNTTQGGSLAWTVDDGNNHTLPISDYWPDGTIVQDDYALTSLLNSGDGTLNLLFEAMNSGEQVVESIKFRILWDDGNWDVGSNGQVIYYDIYFDYAFYQDDPYVFFTSPDEGVEIIGQTELAIVGTADYVEFWANGSFIDEATSSPFTVIWEPDPTLFGDIQIIARAEGENGRVTFLFRNVYIPYLIVEEPVPEWVDDGVNIDGNTVIISLYAPAKEYVAIKGNWNSNFPDGEMMKFSGDTLWWYQTELPDGDYSYQYDVAGDRLMADPWSKDVEWKDPSGNWESGFYEDAKTVFTVGTDPFEWTDQNYTIPDQRDVIVYEMHVGDFKGVPGVFGTYQDIIDKIEEGYFEDLGVTAIELMPVNEFEGENSWGYNPTFYMAPESTYGTPEELKEMVNTAHVHGIAVLMDVVFNHMWGSAPLFLMYQPTNSWDYEDHDYVNDPYFHNQESQWGYKLQHWNPRTRKHIDDVLMTWVQDYHMDGFRFDHTQGIGWDASGTWGNTHYSNVLHNYNPAIIIIAEEDNSYRINQSNFDAGWDYSFFHMMKANLQETQDGGHSFGDMYDLGSHIVASSQGYADFTGPLVYLESHDETRIIYEAITYQGMNLETAHKKSKLGSTILFTSQGTPMLYHGQEFGQNGTSHSGGNIQPQPLQWGNLETDMGAELYQHYRNLILLRKNYEVLRSDIFDIKYQSNFNKSIVYWRLDGSEEVIVVANFAPNPKTINIEFPHAGTWYDYNTGESITIDTNWLNDYEIPSSTALLFLNEIPVFDEGSLIPGDVNLDNDIDVLDIVLMVSFIINDEYPPSESLQFINSDLTEDGTIDVLDIVYLVDLILG
ncbi:MAG: hypothetical protein HN729_01100 [Candidatus Marinimicrobia bacterium]|nr:hypothetical protein [Candidatus Neomarinimicrobiota bacterium]MBT3633328.1 hypothetical protein [Candidatus Neomarinimicrobiota bacterium]MBT3681471.1 hypothetical protein [Candidatus Neomarinimicrobiota bacterium]MBT3758562.1 hypothetical protein [Candidatus Neomarinimicrobiota bacterium]MBT3894784.1 hypothetical protein [Candidatus Neomarinimicrobiota bacterium]